MAGMDILKGAAGSLLGITEKAIIEIEEEDFDAGSVTVTETTARSAGSPLSLASGALAAAAAQAASAAQAATAAVSAVAGGIGLTPPRTKCYKVKFNPSSLSLQSKADKVIPKKNMAAGQGNSQKNYTVIDHHVQLMVELVFDDYERTDAFMMEKLTDPLALARTAAMSIFSSPHSVQAQVEGFITAMRNPTRRMITFHWGGMSYRGTINMLEAEYTMFSIEGRPIRATVKLGILCADPGIVDNNIGQWTAMFNQAFQTSKLDKITGAVGNVLNVKL